MTVDESRGVTGCFGSVLAGWALGELGAGLPEVPGDEGADDLRATAVADE